MCPATCPMALRETTIFFGRSVTIRHGPSRLTTHPLSCSVSCIAPKVVMPTLRTAMQRHYYKHQNVSKTHQRTLPLPVCAEGPPTYPPKHTKGYNMPGLP